MPETKTGDSSDRREQRDRIMSLTMAMERLVAGVEKLGQQVTHFENQLEFIRNSQVLPLTTEAARTEEKLEQLQKSLEKLESLVTKVLLAVGGTMLGVILQFVQFWTSK